MSLQEKLDNLRRESADKIPADFQEVMRKAAEKINNSDMLQHLPAPGTTLPPFTLKDQNSVEVRSEELLRNGPLIISFYRGVW